MSAFMNEVVLEMENIPGVSDVSAASGLPFPGTSSGWAMRLRPDDTDYLMPEGHFVAPGHLEFLGISILEGRGIVPSDDAEAPPVAVVSESLAKAFWGDRSPVGQELHYPMGSVTVVGVADDVKQGNLQDEGGLHFYSPFAQQSRRTLRFAVRTRTSGVDVLPDMREALWRVDEELAITDAGYLEGAIGDSAAEERFRAFLMSVFAGLATILAVVGIMGVTARHVAHRTREVGIRKALGAENSTLLGGVVGEAVAMGAVGIGVGLLGTLLIGRVLAAFLFGVGSFDFLTYAAVAVLFLGVCGLASFVPGLRLLVVDPVTVLREE